VLQLSINCAVNIMETQSDFKELLALLNANHVDYIIVGGYALAYYGLPRFTGDLDLLVKRNVSTTLRHDI